MTDSNDKHDELFDGPSLNADGRLEQRLETMEPARFEPTASGTPELELDRKPAPQIVEMEPEAPPPPPSQRSGLKWVVVFLVLGVLGFSAFISFRPRIPVPDGVSESDFVRGLAAAKGQVIISSTPSGAKIFVDDTERGQTPWAVDNHWNGTVKVRLEARGYKPWEGTFQGGQDQTLDVQLKK
ncbi:MAG: PEGA domain-containing protein [Archangium sp.]